MVIAQPCRRTKEASVGVYKLSLDLKVLVFFEDLHFETFPFLSAHLPNKSTFFFEHAIDIFAFGTTSAFLPLRFVGERDRPQSHKHTELMGVATWHAFMIDRLVSIHRS